MMEELNKTQDNTNRKSNRGKTIELDKISAQDEG